MERIYLDYAATTPLDRDVAAVMKPYFSLRFGNPGSLHSFGQEAMAAVDCARGDVARAIGISPSGGFREIIFTGSATEANNLALRGVVARAARGVREHLNIPKKRNVVRSGEFASPGKLRVVISAVEHESVRRTAHDLECLGIEVVELPVDRVGRVSIPALKRALNSRTILVSVMYVNNEIGTVQPIPEIARVIKDFRVSRVADCASCSSRLPSTCGVWPLFHTDAVQAPQFFDCNPDRLGVDLMTLSAHKIYGPKGVGVLYVRRNIEGAMHDAMYKVRRNKLATAHKWRGRELPAAKLLPPLLPVITGGGQEFGLRSGTENVPLIIGCAAAVAKVVRGRSKEARRIAALRRYFLRGVRCMYPRVEVNGAKLDIENVSLPRGVSSPHILNVYFPDCRSEDLLVKLDLLDVAVSGGPACSSRSFAPSQTLRALGFSKERVLQSIRFSFGKRTSMAELRAALTRLRSALIKMKPVPRRLMT
jgi:cysteine desulfurase